MKVDQDPADASWLDDEWRKRALDEWQKKCLPFLEAIIKATTETLVETAIATHDPGLLFADVVTWDDPERFLTNAAKFHRTVRKLLDFIERRAASHTELTDQALNLMNVVSAVIDARSSATIGAAARSIRKEMERARVAIERAAKARQGKDQGSKILQQIISQHADLYRSKAPASRRGAHATAKAVLSDVNADLVKAGRKEVTVDAIYKRLNKPGLDD